jgi:hypothetical protein
MLPVKTRLWSLAAFLVVAIVVTKVFGVDVYATIGVAILMGAFLWLVGSFVFGVWKGWRD